jgi:thiamine-phosphate pyrophosphorylase
VADALAVEDLDVAYLGISPVYATASKTDLKSPLGLDGIRDIQTISRHRLVPIGGIHAGNTRNILDAGAHGVAVVSAICSAADPAQAARQIRLQISAARQK